MGLLQPKHAFERLANFALEAFEEIDGAMVARQYIPFSELVCTINPGKLSQEAPSQSPQSTFKDADEYISYFEPLIVAELKAEFSNAVEKFARDGGEASAFRSSLPPQGNRKGSSGRKDDAGCPLRAVILFAKVENTFQLVEAQPFNNPHNVGLREGDTIAAWACGKSPSEKPQKALPGSSAIGIVERITPVGNTFVKAVLPEASPPFKDGTEVVLLKLGSIITYQREREALYRLPRATLLSALLQPASPIAQGTNAKRTTAQFLEMVVSRNGLNPSQADAVVSAVKSGTGFGIIQGPPGTGKTRTLVALLNVIHVLEYQAYYESFLRSIQVPLSDSRSDSSSGQRHNGNATRLDMDQNSGSLKSMLASLGKTLAEVPRERSRRPRMLVCAPSNAAVDEALTRIINEGFLDDYGRRYSPELARLGSKEVISSGARFVSAQGQAEAFVERALGPHNKKSPHAGDPSRMQHWISDWTKRTDRLLLELKHTKRTPEIAPKLVDIHEQLRRLERDMVRFEIASSTVLSREEKARRIERTYIEDAQLVFATLSGVATLMSALGGADLTFETLVIDEAAQATEPSSIIPLAFGVRRCMMVGDPQQLPATIFSTGSTKLAYGISLLERLVKAGMPVLLLDTQYRMHPAISMFPSKHFYNSRLQDGANVLGPGRARSYHDDDRKPLLGPYVFVDVKSGTEEKSSAERSMYNSAEADLAISLVKKFLFEFENEMLPEKGSHGIAVVTPYRKQLVALKRALYRKKVHLGDVEVDTVDAFQGREKDVIIFSCVRTTMNRGIGFVRDIRRMNVGITRARCSMIILGNAASLSRGSDDWDSLVLDAKSRGLFIQVNEMSQDVTISNVLLPDYAANSHDSMGSGSETTLARDPRLKREEERAKLLSETRGKRTAARSDPRKTFDSTTVKASGFESNDESSDNDSRTNAVADGRLEDLSKLEGLGLMVSKYLDSRKRKQSAVEPPTAEGLPEKAPEAHKISTTSDPRRPRSMEQTSAVLAEDTDGSHPSASITGEQKDGGKGEKTKANANENSAPPKALNAYDPRKRRPVEHASVVLQPGVKIPTNESLSAMPEQRDSGAKIGMSSSLQDAIKALHSAVNSATADGILKNSKSS
ncbi:hypothetical protein NDN08_000812 [Rhodosorus marinus]|uniref:AAA+ ATPase domain-containing protein n=1 Tax=Rhodosorus marinus TaxID=101924 RepID=A0AAV8UPB5_9RHOD|nr:hypothetical protein NDN08_000812 [Rhodosorus marinus]